MILANVLINYVSVVFSKYLVEEKTEHVSACEACEILAVLVFRGSNIYIYIYT